MKEEFLNFFGINRINKNASFLVAVSGGVDSMVLAHLFSGSDFNFGVAHCNFKLRGRDSDMDEELVRNFTKKLGKEFHFKHFNTKKYCEENGISVQMGARELRYEWFKEILITDGYDFLVTAHHHDDSVETLLFNLAKGTGVKGIRGIPSVDENRIRPLIQFSKAEILAYAKAEGLQWREDVSNQSDVYKRNLIRNKLIPIIEEINPGFKQTMKNTMERLSSAAEIFNLKVDNITTSGVEQEMISGRTITRMSKKIFQDESLNMIPVLDYILSDFGFNYEQSKQVWKSMSGESGRQFISGTHVLTIDREELILEEKDSWGFDPIIIESETTEQIIDDQVLKFKSLEGGEGVVVKESQVATLDHDKLKFPLKIRNWEEGDYFYPLGLGGKKKISDFMIDQKIPLNLKRRLRLLCSENEIVWVIGYRIDDRFKVTDQTRRVLEIRLEEQNA